MYVILCYDVRAAHDRRVRKVVKKYLRPVQRSVMDGFLTEGELKKLKRELLDCIDTETDSVRIYNMRNPSAMQVDKLGVSEDEHLRFL